MLSLNHFLHVICVEPTVDKQSKPIRSVHQKFLEERENKILRLINTNQIETESLLFNMSK